MLPSWPANLQALCFGHKPKAWVATFPAFCVCSSWGSQGNYGGVTIVDMDWMVEKEGE
jgi:hypothetical protein